MMLDCMSLFLNALRLEKLDSIVLRWMANTSHTEARIIREGSDVLLACDHPANTDSRALEAFCTSACDENVAVVNVLDVLHGTNSRRMEHFIRFIQENAALVLFSHSHKF